MEEGGCDGWWVGGRGAWGAESVAEPRGVSVQGVRAGAEG